MDIAYHEYMIRIGYPCINYTISANAAKRFTLARYTPDLLISTVKHNLTQLQRILEYNIEHGYGFFRISSDTVPFASHPVCDVDWMRVFASELVKIGRLIRDHKIRISMHPDQFVLINSPDPDIVSRSVSELTYHAQLIEAMGLGQSAKIQIHVGGIYDDKVAAMDRFVDRYQRLDSHIRNHLVVENDDRLYSVSDCLNLSAKTGVPVILDTFHHTCLPSSDMTLSEAISLTGATWSAADGVPMIDYSSQAPDSRKGKHTEHIDVADFEQVASHLQGLDRDIMLEIKDKEISAAIAMQLIQS